jgi:hypothetical protein
MFVAPPDIDPERILCYGPFGGGKTTNMLTVARWYERTQTPGTFWVLDNDHAYRRALIAPQNADIAHRFQAYPLEVDDWEGHVKLVKQLTPHVKPGDWFIVDFFGPLYQTLQSYFITQVHGMDPEMYWLKIRREQGEKGKALGGAWGIDWQVINKMWAAWMSSILRISQICHLYGTGHAKPIGENDPATVTAMFGQLGMKPDGQRDVPHSFHTVLYQTSIDMGPAGRKWMMTSIRDRERPLLIGAEVGAGGVADFGTSYLMAVAGWTP